MVVLNFPVPAKCRKRPRRAGGPAARVFAFPQARRVFYELSALNTFIDSCRVLPGSAA